MYICVYYTIPIYVSHMYIICNTYTHTFIKHYSLLSMLIYTFQRTILNPYLLSLLYETGKTCQTIIIHYLKFMPRLPP